MEKNILHISRQYKCYKKTLKGGHMEVTVGDDKTDFEKALKKFSSLVKRSEVMQELRRREFFLKPSKKKLVKRQEARRRRKRDEKRIQRQQKYNT
jgi:small subunit ribosomal protein S21